MKKRVDKGILVPFLGLIIVFLVIFGFEYTKTSQVERLSPEISDTQENKQEINPGTDSTNSPVQDGSTNNVEGEVPAASSGSSGGGGSGASGESSEQQETLPEDLYTAACGLYFEKYGVCAGSCPEGECINEGRSCYCKII